MVFCDSKLMGGGVTVSNTKEDPTAQKSKTRFVTETILGMPNVYRLSSIIMIRIE